MFNVNAIRRDFPMLKNKMQKKSLIFFDNASTTFKPTCVIKAINDYYQKYCVNSHRGDYDIAFNVDKMVDETRKTIAQFINAKPQEIVFTSGASMSLNLVAYGYAMKYLKRGHEILLTEAEHASNVLPWFKVAEETGAKIKYIKLNKEGRLTLDNVKKAISKRTKIISIAEVGNVLGYLIPIKEITKYAHERHIIVVCDGAQSVPHHPTNVVNSGIDFLTFSGHKMCGPTGIGVLYGRYDLLKMMDPLMTGGGMNVRFDLCGKVEYLEPPARFEAGTLNLAGIYGLKIACEYLMKIGMENIHKYEIELRKYALNKMKQIKDIIIYNESAESGIITINKTGVFAQDEATFLNSQGIAVRSGQHCAKMLNDFLHTPATLRISFYFYNTKEEIDRLIKALKSEDFLDAYFA